ncbi:hypothetical protein [Streptomyces sp. NBC_01373]|uniref:hypothetical protein n=1 Tax=unclassified Streptomyces TaxID=2593676 RepID=UPI0022576564|nr:hypothetical protein [Streptomyces sp. NBC_01373]MCX4706406.1 hypothetical protein [Streptomyces sp. NBC_01373]
MVTVPTIAAEASRSDGKPHGKAADALREHGRLGPFRGMSVNVRDVTGPVRSLIESPADVDDALLADPESSLWPACCPDTPTV